MPESPFASTGIQQGSAAQLSTERESETVSVEFISGEEREVLQRLWDAEDLTHHLDRVLAFAGEQRAFILELAANSRDSASLARATRRRIATLRTVHYPSEMQAQMREIHNEIWYCGERGDYDRHRIAREWVERHGESWRRWRIKEYLFVAEQAADGIADAINAA